MNAPETLTPETLAPAIVTPEVTIEPYESRKHFAVIFASELKENEPAVLRPVRKTKATTAAMLSELVKREVATLKDNQRPIRVYVITDSKLEAELRPYVRTV